MVVVYVLDPDMIRLFKARGHEVSLKRLKVNVANLGIVTIKELSNFLKRGAAGLDVEDANEDDFEEDPALMRN
jgi:hypothetical protein